MHYSEMKQLGLQFEKKKGRGGARKGAGRPRTKGVVPHARRPFHEKSHPTHVTVRVVKKLGTLRRGRVMMALFKRLRRVAHSDAFARRRATFRVAHFSVMHDHMHLVIEAGSARSMSRGMQGLLAWVARDVNRKLGRRGRLFAERFHARDLKTPREIRNALKYVYLNKAKHHDFPRWTFERDTIMVGGYDPCSSAWWFDGWRSGFPPTDKPPPVCAPKTWLLATGWRRHGLIGADEGPGPG